MYQPLRTEINIHYLLTHPHIPSRIYFKMAPRSSKALTDKTNAQATQLLKENENLKAQLADLTALMGNISIKEEKKATHPSAASSAAATAAIQVSKPIPLPPKRPVSSYAYFMKHVRSERSAELSGMPLAESSGKISEWWKSMSAEEKAAFVAEADKDKARYEKMNEEFKSKKAVYDREKKALEYYYEEEEKKLALTIGLDALAGKKPTIPDSKKKSSAAVEGPKGALNSFMLFSKDRRAEIKAKDKTGKLTHTEITAQITEEWNKLKTSKAKKAKNTLDKYQKKAEEDKVRYTTEKAVCEEAKKLAGATQAANTEKILKDALELFEKKEHEENLMKGGAMKAKEDATLLKEEKKRIREEKKREKEAKAHLPKKACSAYIFFSKDARAKVVEDNPDFSPAEVMKALGAAWKEASAKDKKKFETMAKKDKERYQKEMAAIQK